MDWIHAVQQTLNQVEEHLLEETDVETLAGQVFTTGAYLQKIFRIVTGFSVSDYIRNRRLSLAGEQLAGGGVKVIDAAFRYGYDSPESFTKAFVRFHGVTPTAAVRSHCKLKYFAPLKIQIAVEGGFIMSRKLIPNVEKLYENRAENYMFPSCMRSAMSALTEEEGFDFPFFAGVTGDLFTQIWLEPKWQYNDSYSNVCKESQTPIRWAFDACGYEYSYLAREEIQRDAAACRDRIVESIDRGLPVLAFGIVGPPVCSILCGYAEDGDVFTGWSQFTGETTEDEIFDHEFSEHYFQVRGGLDHTETLIFFGRKKEQPTRAESLRLSLEHLPQLAALESTERVRFGRRAFDAWADSLLCGECFREEEMLEGPLDTYLSCVVQTGTNLHYLEDYLARTAELCPGLASRIAKLRAGFAEEKKAFDRMVEFQGGYFFEKDRRALLNEEFRTALAGQVRHVGELYEKAVSSGWEAAGTEGTGTTSSEA